MKYTSSWFSTKQRVRWKTSFQFNEHLYIVSKLLSLSSYGLKLSLSYIDADEDCSDSIMLNPSFDNDKETKEQTK